MYTPTALAIAVIGTAAAATVPDLTDFSGDVGAFEVAMTSGPATSINWANVSVENTKLDVMSDCRWQYNFDGPNPTITLGSVIRTVYFVTECDTPDFAFYWSNSSQTIQIDYNTTLTGRPVTIGAASVMPAQDCDSATCSGSDETRVNAVTLLDTTGASDPVSQYGYWDVTYRNFTSKIQEGYKSEDFTFKYSQGGYTSCSKTISEAGASPKTFCSGDLNVQFDTAVTPERSISIDSNVQLDSTNTTVSGTAPVRGVCYTQPGGLVCVDTLRVQVSQATA